jgi:hypothetical protein
MDSAYFFFSIFALRQCLPAALLYHNSALGFSTVRPGSNPNQLLGFQVSHEQTTRGHLQSYVIALQFSGLSKSCSSRGNVGALPVDMKMTVPLFKCS